jgi:hypothetical protein
MLWKLWNNFWFRFLVLESRRIISVGNLEILIASSCALMLSDELNSRFFIFSPEKTLWVRILFRCLLAHGLNNETAMGKHTASFWISSLDKEAGCLSKTVSYPSRAQYECWSLWKRRYDLNTALRKWSRNLNWGERTRYATLPDAIMKSYIRLLYTSSMPELGGGHLWSVDHKLLTTRADNMTFEVGIWIN